MNVTVIGGMDRLAKHYIEEAEEHGIRLKVVNRLDARLTPAVTAAEAIILFTNKISHKARNMVVSTAKAKNIPVLMCHSCGVCSLRNCIKCLLQPGAEA